MTCAHNDELVLPGHNLRHVREVMHLREWPASLPLRVMKKTNDIGMPCSLVCILTIVVLCNVGLALLQSLKPRA